VIDASRIEEYAESLDTIDSLDPTADTSAEGQQDIAALLFAQLEFANVVLLNKVDLLPGGKSKRQRADREARLRAVVEKINPKALVIGTQHARVPMATILRTGNFTEDFAAGVSTNWMADLADDSKKHVPETLEYGVSGFYWTADRPFHPTRLHAWLVTYFALKQVEFEDQGNQDQGDDDQGDDDQDDDDDDQEGGSFLGEEEEEETSAAKEGSHGEDDDDDDEEIMPQQLEERKACLEHYGKLFRSKGFIWVGGAERGKHLVSWQQSGSILSFEAAGLRDPGETPQKLTFVGQHLKHDVLKADLESLLMTKAEIDQLANDVDAWNSDSLDDPFEPFPEPEESAVEQHDHDDGECEEAHPRRRRRRRGTSDDAKEEEKNNDSTHTTPPKKKTKKKKKGRRDAEDDEDTTLPKKKKKKKDGARKSQEAH